MSGVRESAFRFPVSDLLSHPGSRRNVLVEATIDWGLELTRVGPRLTAPLSLESASGGLVVRGEVATTAVHTCHRCLKEWSQDLLVAVLEALGVDDDPDGYRLYGDVADLETLLRDAVLLAVPLAPTCREDCRGLCAVCGADLNGGSCPGHDDEPDSPFLSLRGLLDD